MKNIQPIQIWKNGAIKTASVINATIINDNLRSYCTFYWQLKEADITPEATEESSPSQPITGQVLTDGNLTMSGEDYDNWDGSNDYAFDYIAKQINVVIIP